jgi:Holliday junction resolvase-like predicted endonuclease
VVRAARYLLMLRPELAGMVVRFDTLLLSTSAGPVEWIQDAFRTS